MASRRSSRSREDYRHARDPLDIDCRPVLCIRDDDCKISLKSYGGSEGINLTEIQNCVSGGPLNFEVLIYRNKVQGLESTTQYQLVDSISSGGEQV